MVGEIPRTEVCFTRGFIMLFYYERKFPIKETNLIDVTYQRPINNLICYNFVIEYQKLNWCQDLFLSGNCNRSFVAVSECYKLLCTIFRPLGFTDFFIRRQFFFAFVSCTYPYVNVLHYFLRNAKNFSFSHLT